MIQCKFYFNGGGVVFPMAHFAFIFANLYIIIIYKNVTEMRYINCISEIYKNFFKLKHYCDFYTRY